MVQHIRARGRVVFLTAADEAAIANWVFAVVEEERQVVTFVSSVDQAITTDGRRASEVYGWIRPRNWRPRWKLQAHIDSIVLANRPRRRIRFFRGSGFKANTSDGGRPIMTFLTEGDVNSVYDANDRKARSFVGAVYRVLDKFTTNKFAVVDPDARRVGRMVSGHTDWAGHDALNMCRTHDNYFIRVGGWDREHERRLYLAPTDWRDHHP